MKRLGYIALIISMPCFAKITHEPFKVTLESKWRDLEHSPEKIKQFGGKWILAGVITFKKKSNETVDLGTLNLRWKGHKLNKLTASLYKKEIDKPFMPIEDNLICDGQWSAAKQSLILRFNKTHRLQNTNQFYLVLTVPRTMEPLLHNGTFSLAPHGLPVQFQECVQGCELNLTVDTLEVNVTPVAEPAK